jgi:hypothetical protein
VPWSAARQRRKLPTARERAHGWGARDRLPWSSRPLIGLVREAAVELSADAVGHGLHSAELPSSTADAS